MLSNIKLVNKWLNIFWTKLINLIPFVFYILIGAGCVKFIIHYIVLAEKTPLTQLEVIYFTLVTTILTLITSIGITHYFSKL